MTPVRYHTGRFPPQNLDWQSLLPLIGPAHAAVAGYEGMLKGLPNADVLLSPLTSQEAVLSNRIEGTQTTLTEVLTFEAEGNLSDESTPERINFREVLNYRIALFAAIEMLKEIPLSQRLIRGTHECLLRGMRGYDKAPGQYRRILDTCYIGPPGCTIKTARYIAGSGYVLTDEAQPSRLIVAKHSYEEEPHHDHKHFCTSLSPLQQR